MLGPQRVIQEIHTILPYMQFCAATPLQEAMCTVLVDAEKPYEGRPSYYDWLRQQYAGKRHRLEKALADAGIESLKGEGGFFLIGDVSKIKVLVLFGRRGREGWWGRTRLPWGLMREIVPVVECYQE